MTSPFSKSAPRRVTAVVIGGGQAGLAASHCLTEHGIDHVVLERGAVGNAWREERWDSLRLLTPNWQTRLPGYSYRGEDPDGFMSRSELVTFLEDYARYAQVPLETHTAVEALRAVQGGYRVVTGRGDWLCRAAIIASGAFRIPVVPAFAAHLPPAVETLTPLEYRNPGQLAQGGVLVVGAAATGLQLAEEIHSSGRPVTLCVGEHVRVPRLYRGRDIYHWMHVTGLLDESWREVDDLRRARRLPSTQLVGTPEKRDLDLNALSARGVRLVGRFAGLRGSEAQFSGSLANMARLADLKLGRLLDNIDAFIESRGLVEAVCPPSRPAPTRIETPPRLSMDLASGEIKTIIWAGGFRPDYSWLQVPVLDRRGQLRHDGGVLEAPGLYALGLPFMRRRKSSFLFGVGHDARDITAHLAAYVRGGLCRTSVPLKRGALLEQGLSA